VIVSKSLYSVLVHLSLSPPDLFYKKQIHSGHEHSSRHNHKWMKKDFDCLLLSLTNLNHNNLQKKERNSTHLLLIFSVKLSVAVLIFSSKTM
jgi:hypothetical protein